MDQLFAFFRSLTDITDEGLHALRPALSSKSFDRNALLLREGEVCRSLFFIADGHARSYREVAGEERNTAFFFENSIATDLQSFGTGGASTCSIKACEPLAVVVIDKQQLQLATARSPEIDALGRACIRRFAASQAAFADLLRLFDPQERLAVLEKEHPAMVRRVPLTQLASFLGVSRETLSRIRSRRVRGERM